MLTLGDEDGLLEDMKEGVEIAMEREGHVPSDIDPIKFNKLAYLTIREFDLPITFGWYKYGPAPVNVAQRSVSVTPRPIEDVTAADEPRLRNAGQTYLSPEEYSYFYTEDLDEFDRLLETPTKEYLVEFYFEYAPDEYRDLYIASAELQQILDELIAGPSWHEAGEEYADALETRFLRLLSEVSTLQSLEESVEAVTAYERLLTAIVSTAATDESLSEERQRFIGSVVDYFYGGVWRYVALLVSRETVDRSPGENKRLLRNNIEEDLRGIRGEYERELERLAERAVQYDLITESWVEDGNLWDRDDGNGVAPPRTHDVKDGSTVSVEEMIERID